MKRTRAKAALLACALLLLASTHAAAQEGTKQQPPAAGRAAATQTGETQPDATSPRVRRERAYTLMLEGQRYLARARSGVLPVSALRTAQESFRQAAALDPTLAEAHTALAEIAFLLQDVEQAEAEARIAARVNPDNFGARRILSRLHAIKSGLFEAKLDRARAEMAVGELREVVRLKPGDAEGWALLGEFQFALERHGEAAEAFRRWAAAPAPSPADARFFEVFTQGRELTPAEANARLGEALLRAGRAPEALDAIRRAVALAPENSKYLELLARSVEGADAAKQQAVLAELRRAVASNPSNVAAAVVLARTQARLGRVDEAVATLRGALSKLGAANQREALNLRFELAQTYADALRYEEAIAVYEEVLKERGVGNAPLTSQADRRLASFALERIAALRRQAEQPDAALAAVERMRRLLGNDPSADLQQILLLRQLRRREEALEAARQARARHPERDEFLRLEATTLADLGRVDEAAGLLRQRLKGGLEDYDDYLALANLYMEAGRGREAVESARKALELASAGQPALVTQALLMLSSAQERAGDPKGSEESLRRILAREPDSPVALNNLGYFLVERNERLQEALDMIRRAVRAQPTNASFLDSLGWAHFKLGQLEEAERYLSDAARRNPTSATIQEHLGDLHERRGQPQKARAAWQKALALSNDPSESARLRGKLAGPTNK